MPQKFTLSGDDVKRLLNDSSAENRAVTARKVAAGFESGMMSPNEKALAEGIFKIMVKDAAVLVREALADSLKHNPEVPHDVALSLARDVAQVATPMISFSTVLTDDDLVKIIETKPAEHQMAVAQRQHVSAKVAGVLVDQKNEDVVAALVANEGAELTEQIMNKVLDDFGSSEKVNAPMAQRKQLPIGVAERLVTLVSEQLRDHLVTHHALSPNLAADLIMQARERATMGLLDGSGLGVTQLVDQLHKNGRLTPTLCMRALCMGDFTFFEAAVTKLAGIPANAVYALVHDRGPLGLKSVMEKCKFPPAMLPVARAAIRVADEVALLSGDDPERFRQLMIERVLTQFEAGFDPENLDYFIAKLGGNHSHHPVAAAS